MDILGEALTTSVVEGEPARIAASFRLARLEARSLSGFPGPVPGDLAAAYKIQSAAIAGWPDQIVGWKVGRIIGPAEARFGTDRLIGPIFMQRLQGLSGGETSVFGAIPGGFCAVEAELVFRLAIDPPPGATGNPLDWVDALHAGVEIAGSPLATINDLGPTVVVSDFGNNAGLIVSDPVANWRDRLDTLQAETRIEGVRVGTGSDRAFPGGIIASLLFAAKQAEALGYPLKAGMYISTGALTGVHDIKAGQTAEVLFGPDGADGILQLRCQTEMPVDGPRVRHP